MCELYALSVVFASSGVRTHEAYAMHLKCIPFDQLGHAGSVAPGGARTHNPLIRSQMPYPLGHGSGRVNMLPTGLEPVTLGS